MNTISVCIKQSHLNEKTLAMNSETSLAIFWEWMTSICIVPLRWWIAYKIMLKSFNYLNIGCSIASNISAFFINKFRSIHESLGESWNIVFREEHFNLHRLCDVLNSKKVEVCHLKSLSLNAVFDVNSNP